MACHLVGNQHVVCKVSLQYIFQLVSSSIIAMPKANIHTRMFCNSRASRKNHLSSSCHDRVRVFARGTLIPRHPGCFFRHSGRLCAMQREKNTLLQWARAESLSILTVRRCALAEINKCVLAYISVGCVWQKCQPEEILFAGSRPVFLWALRPPHISTTPWSWHACGKLRQFKTLTLESLWPRTFFTQIPTQWYLCLNEFPTLDEQHFCALSCLKFTRIAFYLQGIFVKFAFSEN